MDADAPRVGMFHRLAQDHGPVVGRQVAVDGLLTALVRSSRHAMALFASERELPPLEARFQAAGLPASLHSQRLLTNPGAVDELGLAAWHDPALDTMRPFQLRRRAATPFPITLTHHTLSYRNLWHERYLPLLLSRPRAYDSIVCSSSPAKVALQGILERMASALGSEHGLDVPYDGRFDVIPLGVDTSRFRPRDRAACRKPHDLDDDAFVVLWVGRLSAIDKADLLPLVVAFAGLCTANPNANLVLVCAGQQRRGEAFGDQILDLARRSGVAERVRVLTDVDDMAALHAAADVFVSPSDNLQESFGLTPIEAMASGVPQVVADWDGYRDTVVEGETGLFVPTTWGPCDGDVVEAGFLFDPAYEHLVMAQSVVVDVPALQAALQRLLDEPALREKLAEGSRRRAETHYAFEVVAEAHSTLWDELSRACQAAPGEARGGLGYAMPHYAESFAHYPTRMIDDATELRLSERGRALAAGTLDAPLTYNEQWRYLRVDLLGRCLQGLTAAEKQGRVFTVGRIANTIAAKLDALHPRDVVLRHLLWLAKHDFVRLGPPPSGGPR